MATELIIGKYTPPEIYLNTLYSHVEAITIFMNGRGRGKDNL